MQMGQPVLEVAAQRIHVAALEVEAGIARGSAAHHVKPLVARGHFRYEVRSEDSQQDKGPPRSMAMISPGDGTLRQMEDLRRVKERDQKAAQKAEREAREARDQARLAELEQAAARAADGCPLCGERLLGTGYHCAGCGTHHEPGTLAAMPRLIVDNSYSEHTTVDTTALYRSRSKAAFSTDRHILGSPRTPLPSLDPWLEAGEGGSF
jgi:hypothetical protein